MIDPIAAASLRRLFAKHAGDYPYLVAEAEIMLQNGNGTTFNIKAKTPSEAADILQHILSNDGTGIFNRIGTWNHEEPLYFRMRKKLRLKADNKEADILAFNFIYREHDKPSHVYLSDPEVSDYVWRGDEKVENLPPMSFEGPTLSDLIMILRRAGDCWQDVNFLRPHKRPQLEVVPKA